MEVPDAVSKLLKAFDENTKSLSPVAISTAIKRLRPDDTSSQDLRAGWWAEYAAFLFSDYADENNQPWGTHFKPMMSWVSGDKTYYSPDMAQLDETFVSHWKHRADEVKHPTLRARYADLVWDLEVAITKSGPTIEYAKMAIDSYIACAGLVEDDDVSVMGSIQSLERALSIATQVNDKERIQKVAKAMFELYDRIATPGKDGTWPFLFDNLFYNRKVQLSDEERKTIIDRLENILKRCSDRSNNHEFSPWGAESAAERLAKYYSENGRQDESKRVTLAAGKAFESIAADADPPVAMSWLDSTYERYRARGMKEDAKRVQLQSRKKGENLKDHLKEIEIRLEIPRKEVESHIADIIGGGLDSALKRVASEFIPSVNRVKEQTERLAKSHPFQALVGITIFSEGQTVARVGSVQEDIDGRIMMEFAKKLALLSGFFGITFDRLVEHYKLTYENVVEYLHRSPLFDEDRRAFISDGIAAYFDRAHIKSIHMLVPQIEHLLRRALQRLAQPTNKPGRLPGTMQEQTINDILRNAELRKSISEDQRLFLLAVLADQRALNIRNRVAHGLCGVHEFDRHMNDLLIQVLLVLAAFDIPDSNGGSDQRSPSQPRE